MLQETKIKISNSNKGRVFTEDHRKKLSEAHKGKQAWNKGISIPSTRVNYKHSKETRKKISNSIKNSPNYKNIGSAQRGKPSWCKGLDKSDPRIKKLSESVKKSWERRRLKNDISK